MVRAPTERMSKPDRKRQSGLAGATVIILLILGLMALILGARVFNSQVGLDQREVTEVNMRRLSDSLVQFSSLNLRLPCPAAGGSDAGTEDPPGPSPTCNSPDGVVPWATLGLRRADVLDGWGRKISYRVFSGPSGLTQANGASMVNCNASLGAPIDVLLDANGLCKGPVGAPPGGTPPPNTPAQFLTLPPARSTMLIVEDKGTTRPRNAFVLISHGESGNGAFSAEAPSGRTVGPDAAGKEIVNIQASGTYWIEPRSAPNVQPNAAGHFDDIVEYVAFAELVAKAKLEARSWSAYPLGATFSQPAVAAAAPGLAGENTGQTSLRMGGFLVTGTDSSGIARNLGIRNEDSITGLGIVGGGSSAGDLNSALGERLTFQLGSGSQFQKMDIALNRFRVVNLSPRQEERAEVSFWRGGDLLQTSTVASWVEPVAPARCLFGLVSGAVFDRMDIRPLARTGDGAQTTFSVAEIKACSETTAACTTTIPSAIGCPFRPPSAAATPAQSITATTATLRGTAHDNGVATTVSFDYGTTCSYPSNIAASPGSLAVGAGNTTVTAALTGLTCNTSYYYRTRAVSAGGTTLGNDAMLTTAACPSPQAIASTLVPSAITTTSATLNGLVNDNGASTAVTFDYGTSPCYGFNTAATPGTVTSGSGATAVSTSLTGLTCNTRYHYRVRAVSAAGTTTASDQAFTTAPCP